MGRKDIAAGKIKQVKGKLNDIAGAVKGNTAQQIKGKMQKTVGKVQEEIGKASAKRRSFWPSMGTMKNSVPLGRTRNWS